MQVPAGLDELLCQAQLLLQHIVEREHGRAVRCQGCTGFRVSRQPPGPRPPGQTRSPQGPCSPQLWTVSGCSLQVLPPSEAAKDSPILCLSLLSSKGTTLFADFVWISHPQLSSQAEPEASPQRPTQGKKASDTAPQTATAQCESNTPELYT